MVKPYQKITLKYLGQELNLTNAEVESLLIDLISARKLQGLIDQPEGMLILDNYRSFSSQDPLQRWTNSLLMLSNELVEQYS